MITVKTDFNRRKQEINLYFDFLNKLLTKDFITWDTEEKERISIDLRGISKANIFVMLYNLAESTISAAIEQIHISIKNDPLVTFDNIKDGIKTNLIKNIKNSDILYVMDINRTTP